MIVSGWSATVLWRRGHGVPGQIRVFDMISWIWINLNKRGWRRRYRPQNKQGGSSRSIRLSGL